MSSQAKGSQGGSLVGDSREEGEGRRSPPVDPSSGSSEPGSGANRMLSILTSSQHSLRPSGQDEEGEIKDYSLKTLPSTTSLSESNCSEDGTDL